jgi:hypothetical protein
VALPDIAEVLELARSSPTVSRSLSDLARRRAALRLAKAGRVPDLTVGGGVRWDDNVDGRDYLRARSETRRRAAMPEGTPVIFSGGRLSFATAEDAKALAGSVWETLDKVRERVADLVLVHGGDSKGVDRLAAAWAERRKVPQVAFGLDKRLGARAGFRRNEQMLSLGPRYVVAYAGNGVLERLVIQAKEKGVAVVDRRGPLGTNPKRAARLTEAV